MLHSFLKTSNFLVLGCRVVPNFTGPEPTTELRTPRSDSVRDSRCLSNSNRLNQGRVGGTRGNTSGSAGSARTRRFITQLPKFLHTWGGGSLRGHQPPKAAQFQIDKFSQNKGFCAPVVQDGRRGGQKAYFQGQRVSSLAIPYESPLVGAEQSRRKRQRC